VTKLLAACTFGGLLIGLVRGPESVTALVVVFLAVMMNRWLAKPIERFIKTIWG
jgi:hypothetical protein